MTKSPSIVLCANVLLAGILFSLHHWIAIIETHGDYTPFAVSSGVPSITFDETHAYAPMALRFMTLGKLPAEVDNYERRNASAGVPFVPAVILGSLGILLGSVERAFIAADVLFPALALGLLYAASAAIVHRRVLRLLLAWATLLISFGPRTFFWAYQGEVPPLAFSRTPQPEISFPILILGAFLLARALHEPVRRYILFAAGLVGGLIVSSYYFYAVAWVLALGMLLALTAAWRKWAEFRRIALILLVTAVASIPFVLAAARGLSEGGQTDLLARMGRFTHAPRIFPLLIFVLGLLAFWKFGKSLLEREERHARVAVFVLILLAGLAGLNFQVLTGYDAQHPHFGNRLNYPLIYLLVGLWLFSKIERRAGRWPLIVLTCIVLNAGARQLYVGAAVIELQRASRPEMELLSWVRSNLPVESVIGTVDPNLILLIPAMSANFSYVPAGLRSLTPAPEIVDRYYEMASLLGLSAADVDAIGMSPLHARLTHILAVLDDIDTPHAVSGKYRQYHWEGVNSRRRLDYVVMDSGKPLPPSLTRATVIHLNRRYQLIDLRMLPEVRP